VATPALPSMRVVFFTSLDSQTANGLLQLFDAFGQQVVLVVVTSGPPARPTVAYKDVVANIRPGIDVLVTSHIKRLPRLLRGLEPDLIFVAGFPWRLPPELIALPRLGSINTHPALLPRYRGPDPVFWQVMNGETETGLTVHRIEPEFDTGPILAQVRVPILPDDDPDSIFAKLAPLGPALFTQALAAVAANEPGRPQPLEGASYAPLRTAADRILDWTRPAAQLRNQVRAWGSAGARATLDGQQWIVKQAHLADPRPPGRPPAAPGQVIARGPDGLLVQTGDGLLHLGEVTLDAQGAGGAAE
jgi:methionyl-tRNA formyltransferase